MRGIGKGFHTMMTLIDLKKAFDSLDHTVLLQKMEFIGFKESVIKWSQSYLSNKYFCDSRNCLFRYWTNIPWMLLFLIPGVSKRSCCCWNSDETNISMAICKQWKICLLLKNEYVLWKKTKCLCKTFTNDVI